LIEARFDAISAGGTNSPPPEMPPSSLPVPPVDQSPKRQLNGHSEHVTTDAEDDADDSHDVVDQPAKKKQKREPSNEDADAKLAAKLQAQENQRARTTRGNSSGSKPAKKKKAPRKKSDKQVKAEDDSEVESGESVPKRKAGGGFQKPLNLSYALAELCGEPQVGRSKSRNHFEGKTRSRELT
jgi:hypothetical protein